MRIQVIEHLSSDVSIRRQCELLGVNRSRMYYKKREVCALDIEVVNEIVDINREYPFYGYRRIKVELSNRGYKVNRKRVQRLMKHAGIQALYPKKKTTKANPNHKKYPYLLRNISIDRPNQVWSIDITYIKIKTGYIYLVCLIDVFSRKIMGWSLSPYLDTKASLKALKRGLKIATPEIINSDQGCQYTSNEWVNFLTENGIQISMDGVGRYADNIYIERFWRSIKYEAVYLHSFETVIEARETLQSYIQFYNNRRPHQSLSYKTPNFVYEECFCIYPENEGVDRLNSKCKILNILAKGGFEDSQRIEKFWS